MNSYEVTIAIPVYNAEKHIRETMDSVLEQNLIALIKDDGKRKVMSEAALRNVQRFQIEHIAQQWKFLFELINKKDQ